MSLHSPHQGDQPRANQMSSAQEPRASEESALPDPLPSDISICLFWLLQEALQNAVKHTRYAPSVCSSMPLRAKFISWCAIPASVLNHARMPMYRASARSACRNALPSLAAVLFLFLPSRTQGRSSSAPCQSPPPRPRPPFLPAQTSPASTRSPLPNKIGGLNGSTQHSARTQLAVKTKAKIAC
jgi:hypothetical protein